MEVYYIRFKDKLKQLREKAGLTQEELAQRCGLSVGTIRGKEYGLSLPSWPVVLRLARALGKPTTIFDDCDEVQGEGRLRKRRKAKGK